MHELTLCRNLVDIALHHAQKQQADKIIAVHLALGNEACVQADALTFCFDVISKGTLAESANLAITMVPGREMMVQSIEVT